MDSSCIGSQSGMSSFPLAYRSSRSFSSFFCYWISAIRIRYSAKSVTMDAGVVFVLVVLAFFLGGVCLFFVSLWQIVIVRMFLAVFFCGSYHDVMITLQGML
ncbi:unnamed protein product [Amoebophrya sp. A120]|nr:unnamed protein product [Amoebophrya sp. A120]|eukprot:GSA120T00009071001.1